MSKPLTIEDLKNSSPKELLKRFPKIKKFKAPAENAIPASPAPPPETGLEPYVGEWTQREAKHLINRILFGANKENIDLTIANGLDASVASLLADYDLPEPPINTTAEFNVPIGETWVNSPLVDIEQLNDRVISLFSWTKGLIVNQEYSIREKMTLFWHNHFVVQGDIVEDTRFIYHHFTLLRENALGNFKEFCKKITTDPSMLRYLNGNQNFNVAPNENYARELLELFTIGKGPLV